MKKAKKMFEEINLGYIECKYKGNVVEISYLDKEDKWSSQVEFNLERKSYKVFFIDNENNKCSGVIDLKLHQAIQQQIKELGWESDKSE